MSKTIGARLTEKSDAYLESRKSSALTKEEAYKLALQAKTNADYKAAVGEKEAIILFDGFERNEYYKGVPVPKTPSSAFEEHFRDQDVTLEFLQTMDCGHCEDFECEDGVHFGYKLKWK